METALLVEIEELLFDTLSIRAHVLRDSLSQEGAIVKPDVVWNAHRGVPAAVALQRLAPLLDLDAIGRELVVHRATEHATRIFAAESPSFDAEARDALEMLRSEFALGVVTRAAPTEALRWLESAGLEAAVATVRSLSALDPAEYVATWADGLRRTHAARGVAIAAPAMLRVARRAGLRTIQIGDDSDPSDEGYQPDAQLESLSQIHAALLAAL